MAAIFLSLLGAFRSGLHRRTDLVLENLALRQQLAVFKHGRPRLRLTHPDRFFWITLSRFWCRWREVLVLVKPETVVAWHRWTFRRFWTWRSRHRQPGRPPTSPELRALINRIAAANVGWGAPRNREPFTIPAWVASSRSRKSVVCTTATSAALPEQRRCLREAPIVEVRPRISPKLVTRRPRPVRTARAHG